MSRGPFKQRNFFSASSRPVTRQRGDRQSRHPERSRERIGSRLGAQYFPGTKYPQSRADERAGRATRQGAQNVESHLDELVGGTGLEPVTSCL